jgi:glycerol kinase
MNPYIISIDQSTSCTKAMLFDRHGDLAGRFDLPHRQIIDEKGWVEHDTEEIWANLVGAVKNVLDKTGVGGDSVIGAGLSNQRETAVVWDKNSGHPFYNAIVWQCGRGREICGRIDAEGKAGLVKRSTGINLSPYFSAAKIAWALENVPAARQAHEAGTLCCSTMDSWLIYKMTRGASMKTDYSNASRSQLMNISSLSWDNEICALFGIDPAALPEICDSNDLFGYTDFDGVLPQAVPIRAVMGDSHCALYGQGCLHPGMIKATYGTGSSVMMNVGETPVFSEKLVTSLAWGIDGHVEYVLEGNLNYTGAVIKWLVDELGLLASSKDAEKLAREARQVEGLYLVPAFSGLGAPYWDGNARAMICGLDRTCGKAEIVRSAEECIVYQITDILSLMKAAAGLDIQILRVDGGPTRDSFLMQFQADMAGARVFVPSIEELSGMGAAYAAGISLGLYNPDEIFNRSAGMEYTPAMDEQKRNALYDGWLKAVRKTLTT